MRTLQEWGRELQRDVVIEHLRAWGPYCFLYADDDGARMNFWETDLQERIYARCDEVLDELGDRMWTAWAWQMLSLASMGKHAAVAPMLMQLTKDNGHGDRL